MAPSEIGASTAAGSTASATNARAVRQVQSAITTSQPRFVDPGTSAATTEHIEFNPHLSTIGVPRSTLDRLLLPWRYFPGGSTRADAAAASRNARRGVVGIACFAASATNGIPVKATKCPML